MSENDNIRILYIRMNRAIANSAIDFQQGLPGYKLQQGHFGCEQIPNTLVLTRVYRFKLIATTQVPMTLEKSNSLT